MNNDLVILGIESSCDDTSAAILRGSKVLSNIVANQSIHEKFFRLPPEKLVYPRNDYNGSWSRPSGRNFFGTPVLGMGFRNRISWQE